MRAVPVWARLQTRVSSAASGRWRCDSVHMLGVAPSCYWNKPRRVPQACLQSWGRHKVTLLSPLIITRSTFGASGGYVDLEHTVQQPPTEAAWREGDLTDSSLSQPHITHKTLQGRFPWKRRKSDAMCVCLFCFPRGHRGTGRSAAAPRGTAVAAATHTKLPATVLTREVQAPRARGAAGSAGYRPPLLAVTHESYDDYVSPIPFCTRWKVWLIIISHELCVNQTWFDPPLHVIRMDVASYGEAGHSGTHVWEIRASRKSLQKSSYLINFNS